MNEFNVRRARLTDATAITDLVRAAYSKYIPLTGREPLPMRTDYFRAVIDHPIWLLEHGNVLDGVLELIAHGDFLLVENVAVRPGAQRRGHGRYLMRLAEIEAIRQGFREIRLFTNALFMQNITFYLQLGYAEFLREPFEGGEIVHMKKRIQA